MKAWELIISGGWIMVPLALASIVVWVVALERWLYYRKWRRRNEDFVLNFSNLWLRGETQNAHHYVDTHKNTELSLFVRELLSKPGPSQTRLKRLVTQMNQDLRKGLWILGTLGSSAPFLGLFGTVLGIIDSFQSMAEKGSGGFAVVAAGISQALVATAAGILIALVALYFFNFFQVRVSTLLSTLRSLCEETQELLQAQDSRPHP